LEKKSKAVHRGAIATLRVDKTVKIQRWRRKREGGTTPQGGKYKHTETLSASGVTDGGNSKKMKKTISYRSDQAARKIERRTDRRTHSGRGGESPPISSSRYSRKREKGPGAERHCLPTGQ